MTQPIAFIDLAAQRRRIAREIDAAIARVLDHGIFISGPEVAAFEAKLAAFCGARFAVACGNGTDALQLALMAKGIGPGDAVIVPDFTFTATAEAVALVGGTPVFVDVQAADFTPITTTSFFPAKPLGCYGDGGAILTDDADLVATLKSLRVHGQGTDKYDNVRIGVNSRLDTIQAAILMCKLDIFADEIEARQIVAARYAGALANCVLTPTVPDDAVSVWAQYTVRIPGGRRDEVAAKLKAAGVPTAIYYPKPLHQQTAYRHFPAAGSLAVSQRLSGEVLSLPMHPYLEGATQERIVTAIVDAT